MLSARDHDARIEIGWLGPDEVAWLEEEMRREEQQMSSASLSGSVGE